MNAEQLRTLQAPFKTRYREDPASARQTLTAEGSLQMDRVAGGHEARRVMFSAGHLSAR